MLFGFSSISWRKDCRTELTHYHLYLCSNQRRHLGWILAVDAYTLDPIAELSVCTVCYWAKKEIHSVDMLILYSVRFSQDCCDDKVMMIETILDSVTEVETYGHLLSRYLAIKVR